ncbi:hypothetical protein BT96DRAFT_823421 [Gymnopus androsaceus JB14]|uniref:DUF6314 domain-containing protein n=1 Tax=Gymnopus androsaceus JB14 TaxID=1447944 RepID=A0A6A4HH85_9AGAR|nr:hypothetical protein BT96DRAFT_823421 [Gymnopus androsaceus JB14]
MAISRSLSFRQLTAIFTSLSRDSRPWRLRRTLQSDNPSDINGELRGIASFVPLRSSVSTQDIVYKEEGELPMAGLKWTKKYIWRLDGGGNSGENGGISVWFVKKPDEEEEEADYLFHQFEFGVQEAQEEESSATLVVPPTPPLPWGADEGTVVMAHGNHLCINDMYRTAYSFRIQPTTGEVVSWASRHVVKGPKKNQDIVNLYDLEGGLGS